MEQWIFRTYAKNGIRVNAGRETITLWDRLLAEQEASGKPL